MEVNYIYVVVNVENNTTKEHNIEKGTINTHINVKLNRYYYVYDPNILVLNLGFNLVLPVSQTVLWGLSSRQSNYYSSA